MAFWIDPFILIGCGVAVALVAKHSFPRTPFFVSTACGSILTVVYGVSVGLFVDHPLLRPVVPLLGAETGTEFMINGWILPLVEPGTLWTELSPTAMFLSVVIFATYPAWLVLGVVAGRVAVGRHPDQEGVVGLLSVRSE